VLDDEYKKGIGARLIHTLTTTKISTAASNIAFIGTSRLFWATVRMSTSAFKTAVVTERFPTSGSISTVVQGSTAVVSERVRGIKREGRIRRERGP
jgi:hypothetical protein